MASFLYNRGKKEILDGTISLSSHTIKAMLVTSSYSANPDDDFASTPAAAELSGTGYQAGFAGTGRKTLGSKTFTEDDANNRAEVTAGNLSWTGIDAGTAAAVVLYRHNTADGDSVLIAYIDSGGFPKTTNGGDLNVNWNAEGIFQF